MNILLQIDGNYQVYAVASAWISEIVLEDGEEVKAVYIECMDSDKTEIAIPIESDTEGNNIIMRLFAGNLDITRIDNALIQTNRVYIPSEEEIKQKLDGLDFGV